MSTGISIEAGVRVSTGVEQFLDVYRQQEKHRLAEPAWLSAQRQEAIADFANTGFPTIRDEEWRYTNVAPIVNASFRFPSTEEAPAIQAPVAWEGFAARLVFVNGIFQRQASTLLGLPPGTVVGNLRTLLADPKTADLLRVYLGRTLEHSRHAFSSLNSALWLDGACIVVPAQAVVREPVHLVYLSQAAGGAVASFPRTLVGCERDAQLNVVEDYLSAGDGVTFSNSVTEVVAGEGSIVDLATTVNENSSSFHVGSLQVYAGRSAQVSALSATLSGALVRNEVRAVLDDEGAECTMNGLYAAKGSQHVDNYTTVDHAKPHGSSRQHYNGILDDQATAAFNGRIIVRPNAQKTDAIQKNRNLLLSADATIDTKPQLEISANDVRCTHGATVGQMDQEALFFLRSRGLDRTEASAMLVQAFAGEILDKIKAANYRSWLQNELRTEFLGLQ